MKILYTVSALIALTGYSFRNPQHFLRPEKGATEVLIDGDYPNITKAYEDLDIPVSQYEEKESSGDNKSDQQTELTLKQIKALLAERGIEFNANASKAELSKLLEEAQQAEKQDANSNTGEGDKE